MFSYRTWAGTVLVLSLIGLTNALYLVQAYATGTALKCGIWDGCNVVAASPYSILWGVPLSSWGALFFVGVFILAAISITFRFRILTQLILALALIGFLFSAYFTYLQFAVINAQCIYCLFSAFVSTLLLISAFFLFKKNKENITPNIQEASTTA